MVVSVVTTGIAGVKNVSINFYLTYSDSSFSCVRKKFM